ncbi:hypothetical protein PAPYR_6366 [Paratrimastix pyriformis]|uniref:Tyrosine-protein kinase ephrin type A/B receptor-like domain-containing protein n=1 Tax=Paratrimastix pyriformis TaxID=342808 RepID=A0ABQ8UGR9_9EUKA|nr:hypothetical protein PAPYR_6366 [Paratrimastix pyriformis]
MVLMPTEPASQRGTVGRYCLVISSFTKCSAHLCHELSPDPKETSVAKALTDRCPYSDPESLNIWLNESFPARYACLGKISPIPHINGQLLAVEQNTKQIYFFHTLFGWTKGPVLDHDDSFNLPEQGVAYEDGCLFYGGSYGKPSKLFCWVQPNGAWYQSSAFVDADPSLESLALATNPSVVYQRPHFYSTNGWLLSAHHLDATFNTSVELDSEDHPRVAAVWSLGDAVFVARASNATSGSASIDQPPPELDFDFFRACLVAPKEDENLVYFYKPPSNSTDDTQTLVTYDSTKDTWVVQNLSDPLPLGINRQTHNMFLSSMESNFEGWIVVLLCSPQEGTDIVYRFYLYSTGFRISPDDYPEPLPPPRMGASLLVVQADPLSYMLYVGGFAGGEVFANVSWRLIEATWFVGMWQRDEDAGVVGLESSLPEPRAFQQCVLWMGENKAALLGGLTTALAPPEHFGFTLEVGWHNKRWVPLDPIAPSTSPDWAPPRGLWGHSAALDEATGIVYITGGVGVVTEHLVVYKLDLGKGVWLEPAECHSLHGLQFPLAFHSSVFIQETGQLCLYGGVTQNPNGTFPGLHCVSFDEPSIDYVRPSFTTLDFLTDRYGATMAYLGDHQVIMFGGQSVLPTSTTQLWHLDGQHNLTTLYPPFAPNATVFSASTYYKGTLYVMGGGSLPRKRVFSKELLQEATFNEYYLAALSSCPAGTEMTKTGSGCTACPAGHFSGVGAKCANCPKGSYTPFMGQSSCSLCQTTHASIFFYAGPRIPPQPHLLSIPACLKCSAGLYSEVEGATNVASCIKCPPGTFSPNDGASSHAQCQLCPPGTYSSAQGAPSESSCLACSTTELCRYGTARPTTISRFGNDTTAAERALLLSPPPLKDAEFTSVKYFVFAGLAGGILLVASISIVALCCKETTRPKALRVFHLMDLWPSLVDQLDALGTPLRVPSIIGGLFGLSAVVTLGCFLALNILPALNAYNVKRDRMLIATIPGEAFASNGSAIYAQVVVASLAHHGPCVKAGTADCDDALVPTLNTGNFKCVSCELVGGEGGSCMVNMTLDVKLLGNSNIQIKLDATLHEHQEELLYNSGWWWEIVINQTTIARQLIQPNDATEVFHGRIGTTATLAMTFSTYIKYDITQPAHSHWTLDKEGEQLGTTANDTTFYHENTLSFSLGTNMGPFHDSVVDSKKQEFMTVFSATIGALVGVFNGLGAAKRIAESAFAFLLSTKCCKRRRKSATSTKDEGEGDSLSISLVSTNQPPEAANPVLALGNPEAEYERV